MDFGVEEQRVVRSDTESNPLCKSGEGNYGGGDVMMGEASLTATSKNQTAE